MGSSLRELRSRKRSVATTKKITRAMELIAASRIVKAKAAAQASAPYSRLLSRALSAVATHVHDIDHPLISSGRLHDRAAVLVISSDRGLAGAYSSNVIRKGDSLQELLRGEGYEIEVYLAGRKAQSFYQFRHRPVVESWSGFSEAPTYENAKAIADVLMEHFLRRTEDGGVDEIHVVYTKFVSMMTQRPEITRLLPLEIVEQEAEGDHELVPLYDFEPDAETVLDELLPLYVANRIHYCLLQSAASELASRQKAMKSATDNAEELIQDLTRQANQARQAEITQEITEIVGGASALAEASESE